MDKPMDIKTILAKHAPNRENLLQVLHEIQEADPANHVSTEAMLQVSAWMKIPLSSVYGVLKYYSMYSTSPRGKHIIRVCNSVVCSMRGGEEIKTALDELVKEDSVIAGREKFTIEYTECLGHCEQAPVMMIDEHVLGEMDSKKAISKLNTLNNNTL